MASDWIRSIREIDRGFADPAGVGIEVVERKGLGHPDTLAELLADEFIRRYARHSMGVLGTVPNVCVDKTTLVGALATLRPGSCEVERDGRALLVGKITRRVGRIELPVEELFRASVVSVLGQADLAGLVEHLSLEVINNNRLTDDHAREMYRPPSADLIRPTDSGRWEAADTACLSVEGPLTPLERLAIELERELTGPFRLANPEFGTDVKVLAARRDRDADVTLCVPVKACAVPNRSSYVDAVDKARAVAVDIADRYVEHFDVTCHLNTKDVTGTAYLTAFGSALDKGDQGAVGRGNGPYGVSSSERRGVVEVVAGKNPFHHPAKVYTEICRTALAKIAEESPVPVRIAVTCRNGAPLASPANVFVQLDVEPGARPALRDPVMKAVADCGDRLLDRLPELSAQLALRDPVAYFRGVGERQLSVAT